jgi:asparagine synthase (glutamine-hydrolysing)
VCGIFGWQLYQSQFTDEKKSSAVRATRLLTHRGPDNEGYWSSDTTFFGHRRLKIIDLSDSANQPFIDNEAGLILIYNGEVYNYIELRENLRAHGFNFLTGSDTEVVLNAYKHWGTSCFAQFDGMFAGAILHVDTGKVVLFRDHLGQKPLYYLHDDNNLIFSSELRSLTSLPGFDWRLSQENFYRYIANSYYGLDSSPIKGIKKLSPGHFLEVSKKSSLLKKYWRSIPGENPLSLKYDDAIQRCGELIDKSCKLSMRSDVPYGVLLSGGIDSSLLMHSCLKQNVDTQAFSVSIKDGEYDELDKVKVARDFLGVKNLKTYEMGSNSMFQVLNDLFKCIDEPHGDLGYPNLFFLSREIKKHITVAILGDGADELFTGYLPNHAAGFEQIVDTLPDRVLSFGKRCAESILPVKNRYMGIDAVTRAFLGGFPSNPLTRFNIWLSTIDPERLEKLSKNMGADFFSRYGQSGTLYGPVTQKMENIANLSRRQQYAYFYQQVFLPEFVCAHSDRASMQFSVEMRSPFLSREIIEFSNSIPDEYKYQNFRLKRILRDLAKKNGLPRKIWNQNKHGFTFPLSRWLMGPLKELLYRSLKSDYFPRQLVNMKYLQRLVDEHVNGTKDNHRILYSLMVFENWLKNNSHISID